MYCEPEIRYFEKAMQNLHIQVSRFEPDKPPFAEFDLHFIQAIEEPIRSFFLRTQPRTLYHVRDSFHFSFSFFILPDSGEIFLVGPYLCRDLSDQEMMALLETLCLPPKLLPGLKRYYSSLRCIQDEDMLITLLGTLCETIFSGPDGYRIEQMELDDLFFGLKTQAPAIAHAMGEMADFRIAEKRYEVERQLMHLISQGHTHRAQMIIAQINTHTLENRAADPLRNLKNYGVVLNTLLRKAVENGGVHPLHIDQLSSQMARRLENSRSVDECRQLFSSMVHKYCLLVRNHSMKQFSPLVQHVILRIEADLTADLRLKAHADALNVNASYLSTLFKKETGVTLTDYVTRLRIENAIFLLNATGMQVQTIAQHCGIPDVNYFTKTFKRLIGKTPKEYRQSVRPEK